MVKVTEQYLNDNRTARGAWTAKQFEVLGVAWPPQRGWKRHVIGTEIDEGQAAIFESYRGWQ